MAKDYVKAIVMQDVDTASITAGSWLAFDVDGIEKPCFFIRITNDSNTDVFISYNGSDNNEYIPSGGKIEVNFQTNASPGNLVAKLSKRTAIYARGTAGTGLVYLSGYYNG